MDVFQRIFHKYPTFSTKTMNFLIVICLISVAYGQQTPEPAHVFLVNRAFTQLDTDHDGAVVFSEFSVIQTRSDANGDGCVTPQEFQDSRPNGQQAQTGMTFAHFDHDNNQCFDVADLHTEFNAVDTDNNGSLSRREYDTYFLNLIESQFVGTGGDHVVG